VILNRNFQIIVALILNEKSNLGTSLEVVLKPLQNNRTYSEAEEGRRIYGAFPIFSLRLKSYDGSIINYAEKINENNVVIQYVTKKGDLGMIKMPKGRHKIFGDLNKVIEIRYHKF